MQNLALEIHHFGGNLRAKTEIWSTHVSSVGNLQLFVGKLQLPAPNLFNP